MRLLGREPLTILWGIRVSALAHQLVELLLVAHREFDLKRNDLARPSGARDRAVSGRKAKHPYHDMARSAESWSPLTTTPIFITCMRRGKKVVLWDLRATSMTSLRESPLDDALAGGPFPLVIGWRLRFGARIQGNLLRPRRDFSRYPWTAIHCCVNVLDELRHQPPLIRERYFEAIAGEDPWLGVPEPMRADFVKLAFAYLIPEFDSSERLEILPHVQETLAELKRRGYIMGVVTSRPAIPQKLIEKLAMVGLAAYFDQVVTQDVASLRAVDKTGGLKHAAIRALVLPHACTLGTNHGT